MVPSTSTFNLNNTLGGTPAPCTVVVDPSAIMTGSGTVVGTLTNRGTISPGNSPGTMSVVGSYTQTASGTYIAEVASPSSYDQIVVTGAPGTASLAGTISPVLLGGLPAPGNTVFPGVVTATGGITGTFSSYPQSADLPHPVLAAALQRHQLRPGGPAGLHQPGAGPELESAGGGDHAQRPGRRHLRRPEHGVERHRQPPQAPPSRRPISRFPRRRPGPWPIWGLWRPPSRCAIWPPAPPISGLSRGRAARAAVLPPGASTSTTPSWTA